MESRSAVILGSGGRGQEFPPPSASEKQVMPEYL